MPTIDIPHDPNAKDKRWRPRFYQRDVWGYLEQGGKRAIEIWRRRAGKDEVCLHWAAVAAHQRVGSYWHMLPQASQAKKAIWDAVDPHRKRKRIDIAFPEILRKNTRNNDMFIEFRSGSTWQVVGSDNFHSLVGSPPVGIVFSEWSRADPLAWAYLRPILEENDGWALFITTPFGPNHAKVMYDNAQSHPEWHGGLLDGKATGMDDEQLMRIHQGYVEDFGEVMGEALYQQEYLCSFEAAVLGAVYGKEMTDARAEGRITDVPYNADLPVETWWDLGYRDSTAIWFIQRHPSGKLMAIDYYENHLVGLDHYVKVLQEKPYSYSQHLAPHDAGKGELQTGKSLVQQAAGLGLSLRVQPQETNLSAGIKATRPLIRRTWFDAKKCARGVDALSQYRYEWDEKRKILSIRPLHDWTSHGADAFRTGAHAQPVKRRPRMRDLPRVAIV